MLQCRSHRFIHPLAIPSFPHHRSIFRGWTIFEQSFFPFYGKAGWGRKEQRRKRGEGRIPRACSASLAMTALGLCPSGEQRQHTRIISQEICSCSHWSSPGKGRDWNQSVAGGVSLFCRRGSGYLAACCT